MRDFFANVANWILEGFLALFGGGNSEPQAIEILWKKMCMPLFYPKSNGTGPDSTWGYLSKTAAERKYCRDQIKKVTKSGEVPALTCLLSPSDEAGHLWSSFPAVSLTALANIKAIFRETCKDGVACGVTLYNDDPSGNMPKWWEITNPTYKAAWAQVWKEIGPYISFCILSIESNEKTTSVGMLQHAIQQMRDAMPGAQAYGAHMAYLGKGLDGYRWDYGARTPNNCDMLLVENSWTISHDDPGMGDRQGVAGAEREWDGIVGLVSPSKIVMHEGNLNPGGKVCEAQRNFYRSKGVWGVGS